MWLINLLRVLFAYNLIQLNLFLSTLMGYIAIFPPGIATFILTHVFEGKAGTKTLLKRGFQLNFKKIWLAQALLLVPIAVGFIVRKWIFPNGRKHPASTELRAEIHR
jgi:hypothetical protein